MTDINLWNTRTRAKERLVPLDPENVQMYVCGPTVYDRAHIGNARPAVVFDVLYRLLRHEYGADHVTYVRNLTDVDDKINARAASSGRTIREITDETIGWYHEDMAALGVLAPTHEPRATEYVPQMVAMIEALVAKGHAYEAEGHVLFAVASYPEYGALARRSLDDMRAGARVEVAPYKRDPMDFVLWKPSVAGEPGWESPWGFGRPGWHIECSAMAFELLGSSFDIHGGGIDLAFPHHENELAQSRCAHPEGIFANVWMHNGFLNVEGEKMSKSLGNFFTVKDLLDRGVPGEVMRLVLLSTHYRQPLDWTEAKVEEATRTLQRWRRLVHGVGPSPSPAVGVVGALADDLNTPEALSQLYDLENKEQLSELSASATLLGIIIGRQVRIAVDLIPRIERLLEARREARSKREYARSDAIRGFLNLAGVVVEDGKRPEWRLGYDSDVFGWLTLSRPAADQKIATSIVELQDLARSRGVKFVEDERGYWESASSTGEPAEVDRRFVEYAEREAIL